MRMMICFGIAVIRIGILGISRRQMKGLAEYGDNDTDW
jgi:hypothetical protein